MKMKLFLTFFTAFSIFVQAQSTDCTEKLSLMGTAVKAKDPNAYEYLAELRKNCPNFHKSLYSYGEFAIKYKIDACASDAEKATYVKDLMAFYDEHDTNFPGNGAGNTMKKAMLLFDYKLGSDQEIYALLDKAFKTEYKDFNSARALNLYFELYVKDFKANKNGIALQDVFNKYDDISEKLTIEEKELSDALDILLAKEEAGETLTDKEKLAKNRYSVNLEAFSTVLGSMDAVIVELSTCERLIPFYQNAFEENKNNEQWLKRAADRLEAKECDNSPLFSKISDALYKLNPSPDAAYKLGVVEMQKKNTAKALEYFNTAANLYTDNTKKANVYFKIATMYSKSNKSQARVYARKALAVKPSYGRAYLLIAQLYASSMNECGDNPFDKRAVYWLAAQYCDKAASVDGSLRGTASQLASQYRGAAPSKTEIFQANKAGQRIAFNCWIGESVIVPKL